MARMRDATVSKRRGEGQVRRAQPLATCACNANEMRTAQCLIQCGQVVQSAGDTVCSNSFIQLGDVAMPHRPHFYPCSHPLLGQ